MTGKGKTTRLHLADGVPRGILTAEIVATRSPSGRTRWKLPDGSTYADWQDFQSNLLEEEQP